MADAAQGEASPFSTPALISFSLLAIWMLTIGAFFALLGSKVAIASDMIGILGAIISAETTALSAITGFWLASSLTANRANASKDATISQLAGSGPPPPASPLADPVPAETPATPNPSAETMP